MQEGKEAFFEDLKTQDAVLRNLQVLSESTQRLSDELKERHPEVQWFSISGLRNVLVHNYLGLKLIVGDMYPRRDSRDLGPQNPVRGEYPGPSKPISCFRPFAFSRLDRS